MKLGFVAVLVILLAGYVSAASCLTSSESYAVEAVLPYSHGQFSQVFGDTRFVQSQYDSRLITIFRELGNPGVLSVKIQIPTKQEELIEPRLEISSEIAGASIVSHEENSFGDWDIQCSSDSCNFESDEIAISAKQNSANVLVSIEFKEALPQCSESCAGTCMITSTGQKCLAKNSRDKIEGILKRYDIVDSFDQILSSYKVVGSEQISVVNIVPSIEGQINFEEAMRQELVYLKKLNVISVSDLDIENVAKLSKIGQAGNYRIVKSEVTNKWTYYDKTSNSLLTSDLDCSTYDSIDKSFNYKAKIKAKVYYVIPAIIASAGVFILIVLAVAARIIKKRHKNKKI